MATRGGDSTEKLAVGFRQTVRFTSRTRQKDHHGPHGFGCFVFRFHKPFPISHERVAEGVWRKTRKFRGGRFVGGQVARMAEHQFLVPAKVLNKAWAREALASGERSKLSGLNRRANLIQGLHHVIGLCLNGCFFVSQRPPWTPWRQHHAVG